MGEEAGTVTFRLASLYRWIEFSRAGVYLEDQGVHESLTLANTDLVKKLRHPEKLLVTRKC